MAGHLIRLPQKAPGATGGSYAAGVRRLASISTLALLCCALSACGEEVARASCDPALGGDHDFDLRSTDPVSFWTDLDAAWEGEAQLEYSIEVRDEAGERLAQSRCSALEVRTRMRSKITNIGDAHTRRYLGKLGCPAFEPPAPGGYTVSFRLEGEPRPRVAACELVLKQ